MSEHILIVEDDPSLALGLCDSLEFEGYQVTHAKGGLEAVRVATQGSFSCIILDVMLPDINGYEVCSKIREVDKHVPILMLTARSQEADKIRGLDAGADDYVTKPFSIGELVARVRALFRRATRSETELPKLLQIGECVVDPISQTLQHPERGEERLQFQEVELLKLLAKHQGKPVTRDELLMGVWGIKSNPNNRTVDNAIAKLRKRIEKDPADPQHILTIYGIGYKLV